MPEGMMGRDSMLFARRRDYERLAFLHGPRCDAASGGQGDLAASLRVEAVFGWMPEELEGQSIRLLYPGPE